MDKLILIGAGTHAKSCIDVIESTGSYEIEGFLDPNKNLNFLFNYPIIGGDELLEELVKSDYCFHISIGKLDTDSLKLCSSIWQKLKALNAKTPSIISSSAIVSKYAQIGSGSIIMHNATVNAGVKIGPNSIINTNSLIEHGSEIGENCHISTGSIINGETKVGDSCILGSSCTVLQGLSICEYVRIGAKSLVNKNIVSSGTYLGIPAKLK